MATISQWFCSLDTVKNTVESMASGESINAVPAVRARSCAGVTADVKLALVQRILLGSQLEKSPRLREFLLYIVEREVEGDTGALKEQSIGHAVFKRPQSYDPVADNIVRVQARHLRQKVEEYFAAEGSHEPLILEIPKGKYIPSYSQRETPPAAVPQKSARADRFRTRAILIAAGVFAVIGIVAWTAALTSRGAATGGVPWPWSEFLDSQRRTIIVASDASLNYVQKFAGRPVRLQDYTRPNYPQFLFPPDASREMADLMASTASMRTTSQADIINATQIMRVFGAYGDRLTVRLAREGRYRELQENNLIIIGTAYGSNPWASLFEPKLNFQSGGQPKTDFPVFRNMKPLPGEQAEYVTAVRSPNTGDAYGVIALLKHPDHSGRLMLVQGATMEASEAVCTYLLDPAGAATLRSRLGTGSRGNFQFEALLQTKAVSGTATQTTIVASRLHE
jgi:hypothetical protein